MAEIKEVSVTREPRTMTAEREAELRKEGHAGMYLFPLWRELDAERAAHAEIIKAADALRDALEECLPIELMFRCGPPYTITWSEDSMQMLRAALAQYKAAKEKI